MAGFRIPQSVAYRAVFKAYLSSDHVSVATGKTLAVVLSKNGGAFANPSAGATNATEIASGWYYADLSTTDTGTKGPLIVRATAATVDDVETVHRVVDAHNADFDGVPAVTAAASGGLLVFGTGTGAINPSSGSVPVTSNVKKNAALAGFEFVMTDSTNHAPATGLTVAATRSIDGAGFASCANSVSAISNGAYKIDLAAADLNGNTVILRFAATGADDLFVTIVTQP